MSAVDIESIDRRVKWWLLAVSLATLALLIVAALEENVFSQWHRTRAEYAVILQEKAIDPSARTVAEQFKIAPDQHVLPELDRVDRCITCHTGIDDQRMADQEQPFRTHPGDILSIHPAADYGCTICHQGQAQATALPDAHGHVPYWPEPMIPARHAYAGCGVCHTHLDIPNQAGLSSGRNMLERYDCLACHRIDGRGGTLRPDRGGMEGPDLSHMGTRSLDAAWYEAHLEQFRQAEGGPWKTSFGPIAEADRGVIEGFLATRVGAAELVEAKSLFHTLGCLGCHKIRGTGGDDGPDLTHLGEKSPRHMDFSHVTGERTLENWLGQHLRWPAKVVPGSQMPVLGLTDEQIDKLTLYLLSLREMELPEHLRPKDRILAERFGGREFAGDGATLYTAFCAACHGPEGRGRRFPETAPFPSVANADLLAAADDAFLAETIRNGRPGRRMPAWNESEGGLRKEEMGRLVAHLRELGGVAQALADSRPRRWVQADPHEGAVPYAAHCAACHGPAGEGPEAPALNNAALLAAAGDTFLVETIQRGRRGTPMPGFGSASPAYPALSEEEIHAIVAFLRSWENASP